MDKATMIKKWKDNEWVAFNAFSKEEQEWLQARWRHVEHRTAPDKWVSKATRKFNPMFIYRLKQSYMPREESLPNFEKAEKEAKQLKTIMEWLDELPHGWKEDAVSSPRIHKVPLSRGVTSLKDAVFNCCDFNRTAAGYLKWNSLYYAVFNKLPLPAYPCQGVYTVRPCEAQGDQHGIKYAGFFIPLTKLPEEVFAGVQFVGQRDSAIWYADVECCLDVDGNVVRPSASSSKAVWPAIPCRVRLREKEKESTILVSGSHGSLTVSLDTGNVLEYTPTERSMDYSDIVSVDLDEYKSFYGHYPVAGEEYDILDFATYHLGDENIQDHTEFAENSWREETVLQRREYLASLPNYHLGRAKALAGLGIFIDAGHLYYGWAPAPSTGDISLPTRKRIACLLRGAENLQVNTGSGVWATLARKEVEDFLHWLAF